MIQNTPTFQNQLHNCFIGNPGNKDTRLYIPYLEKDGRHIKLDYKAKAYLPNPVFPIELYEYRRDSQIQLSVDGKVKSKFADLNINRQKLFAGIIRRKFFVIRRNRYLHEFLIIIRRNHYLQESLFAGIIIYRNFFFNF